MRHRIKLTSVNLIEEVYNQFKITSLNKSVTFQKFVNRALDLYNNDETVREKINNHDDKFSNDLNY